MKERAAEAAAAAAAAVNYCSVAGVGVGAVTEPFLTTETKTLRSRETMIFMVKRESNTLRWGGLKNIQ